MRALVAVLLSVIAQGVLAQSNNDQVLTDNSLIVSNFLLGNNIDNPTGIRFTGPNQGFVIEQGGAVKRFNQGAINPVLNLSVATDGSERGLLGIAIDPGHAQNGYVYLYYTAGDNGVWVDNRLERYTWNSTTNTLTQPQTLATFGRAADGQSIGASHNGGPLVINGGKIYGTTGDLNRSGIEQNQSNTNSAHTGGTYRLELDGATPPDNRFIANANADVRRWYTYGVRNSFGIAVDPANGRIWNTENGAGVNDEINLLSDGMNSGWTPIMGPATPQGLADLVMLDGATYVDPKFTFEDTIGITALQFLYLSAWGPGYDNAVLVGENNEGRLWLFRLNTNRDGFELAGELADGVLNLGDTAAPFGTGFSVVTDIQRNVYDANAIYVVALGEDAVYRIAPIPEPGTWALSLAGLGLVLTAARRRSRRLAH
ncbi:MAG: PQQ-dependent sugar dehydrogenase [Burkholderiales bacterium]|nr:PQQ-dependent sugar dehydrogenase [Burkholderiales bacterium]